MSLARLRVSSLILSRRRRSTGQQKGGWTESTSQVFAVCIHYTTGVIGHHKTCLLQNQFLYTWRLGGAFSILTLHNYTHMHVLKTTHVMVPKAKV